MSQYKQHGCAANHVGTYVAGPPHTIQGASSLCCCGHQNKCTVPFSGVSLLQNCEPGSGPCCDEQGYFRDSSTVCRYARMPTQCMLSLCCLPADGLVVHDLCLPCSVHWTCKTRHLDNLDKGLARGGGMHVLACVVPEASSANVTSQRLTDTCTR